MGSIKRVTDIMGEIAVASQEQTRGIEQVNQAITQMDQVTQRNAALVEEASAAAQSMREQAGALVQAVSVFRRQTGEGAAFTRLAPVQPQAAPAQAVKQVVQKPRERLPGASAAGRGSAPQLAMAQAAAGAAAVESAGKDWTEF